MIAENTDIRLILEDIRSVQNVGSIFRTAECAGVSRIYCCGTTPSPVDRFGRARKDLVKVALGAEKLVAWEYVPDARSIVKLLKRDGFQVIAVEQDRRSVDYSDMKRGHRVAYILGNEVEGVSKALLNAADVIVEIPLRGKKESLNVAVAAGIVLFAGLGRK